MIYAMVSSRKGRHLFLPKFNIENSANKEPLKDTNSCLSVAFCAIKGKYEIKHIVFFGYRKIKKTKNCYALIFIKFEINCIGEKGKRIKFL